MASEQVVSYVLRYGGRCRDCADEDGICPTNGIPCEPEVKRAVINHTLKALGYGISHGFIADPFTRPAPAATDTGLETVEHQYWHDQTQEWLPTGFPDRYRKDGFLVRELVTRSQAEELLAAERAAQQRLLVEEANEDKEAIEAKLAAAEKALTEIASFTQTTDLLWWQERARAALGGKPS